MGFKWIKRFSSPETNLKSLDDYCDTYDPKLRYMTFKIVVPSALRELLPIPKDLVKDAGFLYVFNPMPPNDHRTIIINEIEGSQSMSN